MLRCLRELKALISHVPWLAWKAGDCSFKVACCVQWPGLWEEFMWVECHWDSVTFGALRSATFERMSVPFLIHQSIPWIQARQELNQRLDTLVHLGLLQAWTTKICKATSILAKKRRNDASGEGREGRFAVFETRTNQTNQSKLPKGSLDRSMEYIECMNAIEYCGMPEWWNALWPVIARCSPFTVAQVNSRLLKRCVTGEVCPLCHRPLQLSSILCSVESCNACRWSILFYMTICHISILCTYILHIFCMYNKDIYMYIYDTCRESVYVRMNNTPQNMAQLSRETWEL